MLRNAWFWLTVLLVLAGVALTAALGALPWLIGLLVIAFLALVVAFVLAAYRLGAPAPIEVPSLQDFPQAKQVPVMLDADVTLGRPFRDVGGGLALLYLLGEPRVRLLGVTATYGDGAAAMSAATARGLLAQVGREEVEVVTGAPGPGAAAGSNLAARLLVQQAAAQPGTVVLIATGSMTNLKHALALDPDFFRNLRALHVLGGVLSPPLTWNERRLAERNITLDPVAAYQALHAECPLTIVPCDAGTSAIFRGPEFAALESLEGATLGLIARKIRFWFALTRLYFSDGGFAMWDSLPALMLTTPGLFDYERVHVLSALDDLANGRLVVEPDRRGPVRLVHRVRDKERFVGRQLAAWRHIDRRSGASL